MSIIPSCGTFLCVTLIFCRLFQVFFYKVNYLTGRVSLSEDYCDHVWVTKEEMEDLVDPEYYKSLKRFLS